MQVSNLEDGISVGSLSEAEEKTIRTAFEELNVSSDCPLQIFVITFAEKY